MYEGQLGVVPVRLDRQDPERRLWYLYLYKKKKKKRKKGGRWEIFIPQYTKMYRSVVIEDE